MDTRSRGRRSSDPDIAHVAAAISDPARAAMLLALLDGRRLSASSLASIGGVSRQSASGHLGRLRGAGLVSIEAIGRNRFYAIASREVALAIEAIAAVAPRRPIVSLRQNLATVRMREARSCYDHLAGRLAVAIADRLVERGLVRLGTDAFIVTRAGDAFFMAFGIHMERTRDERRAFARTCLDLNERRAHLAGSLGAAMLDRFLERGWLARYPSGRALEITSGGRDGFARDFGVAVDGGGGSAT